MDAALCDELIQEIFLRLPPPSSASMSLVSKRWLRLHRSSKSHLSLRLYPNAHTPTFLSSFLSHFPFLLSLSLSLSSSGDSLLLSAAASCPNLRHLRLPSGPVSAFLLLSLSSSCPHLISLSVSLSRPFSLHFLPLFRSLKDLSLSFSPTSYSGLQSPNLNYPQFNPSPKSPNFDIELQLESLTLSCIRKDDNALDWLYRSCKKLKKLQFRGCEGIGDNPSSSSFINCIKNIKEVELRTCRMIINVVLLKLAENSKSLKSLLIYDGGCREGLLRFIERSQCNLQTLDLRLPLDLDNRHLLGVAQKFKGLTTLRLQSCCLVIGEGLKAICSSTRYGLDELALINCDVAEREPGLLTALGQSLKGLKKLDLSYNEILVDKELVSMIVSCGNVRELKLRGCRGLSNLSLVSISKSCKDLECIDIMYCCGINAKGVELFVLNSPRLRLLKIEANKLLNEVKLPGLQVIH